MRKSLLAFPALVLAALTFGAAERSPIVYNFQGYEVGVIQYFTPDGAAIMQPTVKTLGLGQYNVAIRHEDLRPRARGGWETDLTNDEIAYIPPVTRRFFMASGT